jgi:hypothetical protein
MDPTTAQNDSNKQPPFVREGSGETERPPSAQRVNIDTTEQTTEEEGPIQEGEDELDSDVDPADMIEDFDWDHLYEEYHSQMDALSGEEATLMEEWVKLMHVRHPQFPLNAFYVAKFMSMCSSSGSGPKQVTLTRRIAACHGTYKTLHP